MCKSTYYYSCGTKASIFRFHKEYHFISQFATKSHLYTRGGIHSQVYLMTFFAAYVDLLSSFRVFNFNVESARLHVMVSTIV